MKQHLTDKGVPYRVNQVPKSTRWQIFLRDPNNVEIELNFETRNEVPAWSVRVPLRLAHSHSPACPYLVIRGEIGL